MPRSPREWPKRGGRRPKAPEVEFSGAEVKVAITGAETSFGKLIYQEGGDYSTFNAWNWFWGPTRPLSDFTSWADGCDHVAAGLAGTIEVSRIASGEPTAGSDITLDAIAAIILGGTSIYGGSGAIWRSLVGVYLLALIGNGFNILNANPFFIDLTTGIIIVGTVALSASRRTR